MSKNDTIFRFTITNRATDKEHYQVMENSIDGFVQGLVRRGHGLGSKDGSGIIAALFHSGTRLEQKNVESVTGLILDVDGKFRVNGQEVIEAIDPAWFLNLVQFRGVAHTSYNHTPAHPKFRVILPLAEQVTMEEFRRLWWWMYERTNRKIDASTKNPDRMFYLPRCTPEAKEQGWPWIQEVHGPVLSINMVPDDFVIPDLVAGSTDAKPRRRQGAHFAPEESYYHHTDAAKLLAALMELPVYKWAIENPSDVSREVWRGLATNIAAAVVDEDDAHDAGSQAFHDISSPDQERYNYGITEKTFRDALRSAKHPGPMTYGTMILNGAPEDSPAGSGAKSPIAHARNIVREQELKEYTRPKHNAPSEASAPPAEGAPASAAPPPPAQPEAADQNSESDDDVFDHSAEDFLFDIETNGWLIYHRVNDIWSKPITDSAFNMLLMHNNLPEKHLKGFKSQIPQFHVRQAVFNSTEPIVKQGDLVVFNTYKPTTLVPMSGGWDDIRFLILNLVGDDLEAFEYVLDWLAAPLQSLKNKGEPMKMGTALVLLGEQGSGKGTLSTIIEVLYGFQNVVTIGQDALEGRFNDELIDKLFVIANEVMSSTNRSMETANKIKPWVTDDHLSIEEKFKGRQLVKNCFNIIFTSNDERPVILEKSDRRYSVFRSKTLGPGIGKRIKDDLVGPKTQVAAFYHHLLSRKVKVKFGELFHSVAREAMMMASSSSAEKFAYDVMVDGWLSVGQAWADDAPSGKMRELVTETGAITATTLLDVYRDYCRRAGYKSLAPVKVAQALQELIPTVRATRFRYGGALVRGWDGIPLHPRDAEVIELPSQKPEPTKVVANSGASNADDADFGDGPSKV